jgi:hypothetical protein
MSLIAKYYTYLLTHSWPLDWSNNPLYSYKYGMLNGIICVLLVANRFVLFIHCQLLRHACPAHPLDVYWDLSIYIEADVMWFILLVIKMPPVASDSWRKGNMISGLSLSNYSFSCNIHNAGTQVILLLWLYSPLLGLGRFFSYLILYTVGGSF